MNRSLLVTAACALGIAGALGAVRADTDRVAYPQGYGTAFVRYLQVDRPDRPGTRFMYMSRPAFDAARPGEPLPDGTVLVMEDHAVRVDDAGRPVRDAQGRFIATDAVTNVFVMEKRSGWGADRPPESRNGDWDYAWFEPDGARKAGKTMDGCFACHANRAGRDFTFTAWTYLTDTR